MFRAVGDGELINVTNPRLGDQPEAYLLGDLASQEIQPASSSWRSSGETIEGLCAQQQVAIEAYPDHQQSGQIGPAQPPICPPLLGCQANPISNSLRIDRTALITSRHSASSPSNPQTEEASEEKIPDPAFHKRKGIAETHGKSAPEGRKRVRRKNFTEGQSRYLMDCLERSLTRPETTVPTEGWSEEAAKKLGRDKTSCQQRRDSIFKQVKAIRGNEEVPGAVSFWKMTKEQKRTANDKRSGDKLHKLPPEFSEELFKQVQRIMQIMADKKKKNSSRKRIESTPGDTNLPSPSTQNPASTFMDSASLLSRPSDATGSQPSPSDDQDSTIPPAMPLNGNILASNQGTCQRAQEETKEMDEALAMPEDLIMARLTPLITKTIEDSVEPLVFASQRKTKDEQEHRDKMLAIETEKLATQKEIFALMLHMSELRNVGSDAQSGVALNAQGQHANIRLPSRVMPDENSALYDMRKAHAGGVASNGAETSSAPGQIGAIHQTPAANTMIQRDDLHNMMQYMIRILAQAGGVASNGAETSSAPGQKQYAINNQMPAAFDTLNILHQSNAMLNADDHMMNAQGRPVTASNGATHMQFTGRMLANSMGNTGPYDAQAGAASNVDLTNLAHGHHADIYYASFDQGSYSLQNDGTNFQL